MKSANTKQIAKSGVAYLDSQTNHKEKGYWEIDFESGHESWDTTCFKLLGYSSNELIPSYHTFIDKLVHREDKPILTSHFDELINKRSEMQITVRLKLKSGLFRFYELSGCFQNETENGITGISGSIADVHDEKMGVLQLKKREDLLSHVGNILKFVTWEYSLSSLSFNWTSDKNQINEIFPDLFSYSNVDFSYFNSPQTLQLINNCITNKIGFENEVEFFSSKGAKFSLRIIAWPLCKSNGEILSISGIIQNINIQKQEELTLSKLNRLLEQNKRLLNYSYSVSHNLNSHSSNLSMLADALKRSENEKEKETLLHLLELTSKNLSETVQHLQEVVSIQTSIKQEKKICEFDYYYQKALTLFKDKLSAIGGSIEVHFEDAKSVEYIPAYMDSLFFNMLSNAIKYRRSETPLHIEIKSGKQLEDTWISFKDNGMGIDLKRNGDKLFGMYNTFHRNPEAKGLGLFLTRNQFDTFGGEVLVESSVGEGSCFTFIWKNNSTNSFLQSHESYE